MRHPFISKGLKIDLESRPQHARPRPRPRT